MHTTLIVLLILLFLPIYVTILSTAIYMGKIIAIRTLLKNK